MLNALKIPLVMVVDQSEVIFMRYMYLMGYGGFWGSLRYVVWQGTGNS